MPYENLYRAHALDGSLFFTVCIRKAALLIALDNEVRDQSEIDADLPNDGDYAPWMSAEAEPKGKLKAARDVYERSLLKSLSAGRLEAAVVARNLSGDVDPIYTLIKLENLREWCLEHDTDDGDWLTRHEETEMEFAYAMIDDIVVNYTPVRGDSEPHDEEAFQAYKGSDESARAEQFRKLLQENQRLRAGSTTDRKLVPDLPLNTRERNSLLTVIAALIAAFEDRLPEPEFGYKRAQAIALLTEQLGAPVSTNTVDKILKQIDDAINRRRGA